MSTHDKTSAHKTGDCPELYRCMEIRDRDAEDLKKQSLLTKNLGSLVPISISIQAFNAGLTERLKRHIRGRPSQSDHL